MVLSGMTVIFGIPTPVLAAIFFGLAALGLLIFLGFDRMPLGIAASAAAATVAVEAAVIAFAVLGFTYNVGDQSEDLAHAGSIAATSPAIQAEQTASAGVAQ